MYGISLSAAKREIELVGWETLNDVAFLRGVAHARELVKACEDETKLPDDPLTQLVADVYAEVEQEKLHERERKAGLK